MSGKRKHKNLSSFLLNEVSHARNQPKYLNHTDVILWCVVHSGLVHATQPWPLFGWRINQYIFSSQIITVYTMSTATNY